MRYSIVYNIFRIIAMLIHMPICTAGFNKLSLSVSTGSNKKRYKLEIYEDFWLKFRHEHYKTRNQVVV